MKFAKQVLRLLLTNSILLTVAILSYPQIAIWSHYIAPDFDTSPFYLRYLEKPKDNNNTQPSFFILNNEFNRGAFDNRNINNTTLYGDFFLRKVYLL